MNIQSETLIKLNSWGQKSKNFGFGELSGAVMELTEQQTEAFDKDGYLFFPELFTPEEVKKLNDAVPELYDRAKLTMWGKKVVKPSELISRHTFIVHRLPG